MPINRKRQVSVIMYKIIFITAFLLLQHCCFCQGKAIDSLKTALQNAKTDTARLTIYLALGDIGEKNDKLLYAEQAFTLVDKLLSQNIDKDRRENILKQEAKAYDLMVTYYESERGIAWDSVMNYTEKRLRKFEQTDNKKRNAETLLYVANIDREKHDTVSYLRNAQKSLALFNEIKDTVNIVSGYINLYKYFLGIGNFSKALEFVQSAITISRELNYQYGIATSLARLADLYRDYGEDAQALKNYETAMTVSSQSKDTNSLCNVLAAIGGFYYSQHNAAKALEYYNRLLEIYEKQKGTGHEKGGPYGWVGVVYKWIGIVYKDNDDYNNAIINFERGLSELNSTNNLSDAKQVLDELGSVYNKKKDFGKAVEYHTRAADFSDSLGWKEGKAWSQYLLAFDHYTQKNYKAAEACNNEALAVLKKYLDIKSISDATLLASLIDSATGNGMGAYEHYKEYISLSNKLRGEEIRKEAQKEKFQAEIDNQKAGQQKKDAEAKRIKNQQYFIIAVLSVIVLAVVVIALRERRNNKQKQKTNLLLQKQKEKLQQTLEDLKSTQAQLIQSEKMASLGELTAGIAHEIQNPLNFVNNFSEVNGELIEELQDERRKAGGERDEVLEGEIINDIKQNLEKIHHHGKRADSIVKGMLQHSRQSSGTKEPTNINALCDEYLRLAYHGLRAKDKSFNADFKTGFDESIGKINIVQQDVGRVLLNLFNNAFYAVNERQKAEGIRQKEENSIYVPTVVVVTKKTNDKVEITVTDNGPGIPQNIKEKIFQPFFTTKPTGQGTGLGLSLAYDIIKAHGGEIKVKTKEGEGTEFIIQLPNTSL